MSKLNSFQNCKNVSSNQTDLLTSYIENSSNLNEAYIKMIKYNEECIKNGKEALLESNNLENKEYSEQAKKAIDLSIQRMQSENKMYSILLNQKDFSNKNNAEVSDQLNIIVMFLNKYIRPQEIKAWELTSKVSQGQPIASYQENISISSVFSFLIIVAIFYTYAKTKIESDEKEKNKNNDK